jgi:hypothetical protein
MLKESDLKAIDDNWTEACHAVNRRNDGQPFSVEAIVESATDVPLLYDMVRDLQARLEDREAKIEALQAAVRRHRDERGDDRCWMDDERLYDEALPEGCQDRGNRVDRRLHCPEEMMRHCQQFIVSRQPDGQPYVSPQREIDRLRAALERIACRDQGEVGPHMEEPRAAAIAREVLG